MKVEKEYYENGELLWEVIHEDEQHSTIKWWYENGQLWRILPTYNKEKHGVVRSWYSSGKLMSIRYYISGNQVSEEEWRRYELILKLAGIE